MANPFSFKEVTTRTMKVVGILDSDKMLINVDGEEKSISTLLSAFEGLAVEMVVKVKYEADLDEPVDEE